MIDIRVYQDRNGRWRVRHEGYLEKGSFGSPTGALAKVVAVRFPEQLNEIAPSDAELDRLAAVWREVSFSVLITMVIGMLFGASCALIVVTPIAIPVSMVLLLLLSASARHTFDAAIAAIGTTHHG